MHSLWKHHFIIYKFGFFCPGFIQYYFSLQYVQFPCCWTKQKYKCWFRENKKNICWACLSVRNIYVRSMQTTFSMNRKAKKNRKKMIGNWPKMIEKVLWFNLFQRVYLYGQMPKNNKNIEEKMSGFKCGCICVAKCLCRYTSWNTQEIGMFW